MNGRNLVLGAARRSPLLADALYGVSPDAFLRLLEEDSERIRENIAENARELARLANRAKEGERWFVLPEAGNG